MRSLWFVALAACSSPADEQVTPPTPVAKFDVTVEGDGSLDPTQIRLAIVWDRGDKSLWPARLLEPQELFISSHTVVPPLRYQLGALQPPPYDAFFNSPSVGVRFGSLVAYLDRNANGRLDFTPVDAPDFVDRIVAFHPFLRAAYFTTVDVWSLRIGDTEWTDEDSDATTPVTLRPRSEPRHSCALLEDWETEDTGIDWTDPGPWDHEMWQNAPCPGNELPELACGVDCFGEHGFQALESIVAPSPFIAQTCGRLLRQCMSRGDARPPSYPCPCDPNVTSYLCEEF